MDPIIVIAILIVLLVAAFVIYRKKSSTPEGDVKKAPDEPEPTPKPLLTGTLVAKLGIIPGATKKFEPRPKSADEMFAEANGKWVCPQCELIHNNAERVCRVCGYRKNN